MPFAVPRALPLTLLAAVVLAGCAEKGATPLKEGEKPVDVASVVRQKMPASVKDRSEWADALATTFKSQKIAPTEENICSVLAVGVAVGIYFALQPYVGTDVSVRSCCAWPEQNRLEGDRPPGRIDAYPGFPGTYRP